MDVSRWIAWSLVLIPVAAVFTIATLVRDERRANRAFKANAVIDLRNGL